MTCRHGLHLSFAKGQVKPAGASSQSLAAQAAEAQVSVVRQQAQVQALQQRRDTLAVQAAAVGERLRSLGQVSSGLISTLQKQGSLLQ
jgi:hypothetical protein